MQIGFTLLVPAYQGCSGKEVVKWMSVCTSFAALYQAKAFLGEYHFCTMAFSAFTATND